MYALKIVNEHNGRTSVHCLGKEFHIQKPRQGDKDFGQVATVIGEYDGQSNPSEHCVFPGDDAFVTTLEGKTVEVVNRSGWHA